MLLEWQRYPKRNDTRSIKNCKIEISFRSFARCYVIQIYCRIFKLTRGLQNRIGAALWFTRVAAIIKSNWLVNFNGGSSIVTHMLQQTYTFSCCCFTYHRKTKTKTTKADTHLLCSRLRMKWAHWQMLWDSLRYVCNLKLCLVDWYSTLTPTFYEEAFRALKSLMQIADISVVRFVDGVNECSKTYFSCGTHVHLSYVHAVSIFGS